MKLPASLLRYGERVDALTLRERLFIFLAALAVLVALFNFLFLEPLFSAQAADLQRLEQQRDQILAVQTQMSAVTGARNDRNRALGDKAAQLANLREQLAGMNRDITTGQARLVAPQRMNAVVTDILRRNRGVQLVSMKNLPTVPMGNSGPDALYRHGLEVVVTGGFSDLVAYLGDFDRLPVKVSWGTLDLDASTWPRVSLDLVVSTLSTDRPWLQI